MKDYYDFEEYENYYKSRDPHAERVILHSDLNNFFASVESIFTPSLKKVPFAVCGNSALRHGIVLAKNEIAKKYGIKTGDRIDEAKRKCTNVVIGDSHYDEYVKYSRLVRDIYLSFATRIEPFGIDEAWIDVSDLAHKRAPNDYFAEGVRIAEEIRQRVKRELGLTVSVGVSFNKVFAKLASDMKKPDAVTAISFYDFKNKIWPLPVDSLLFVGKKTKEKLKLLKIEKVGELALQKRMDVKRNLGKFGESLWDTANGYDLSQVSFYHSDHKTKSISNSTTLPFNITTIEEAQGVIISLSESVSEQLRQRGEGCSSIKLYVKFSDFSTLTRQVKLKEKTFDSERITKEVMALFKKHVKASSAIRALGVGVDGLSLMSGDTVAFEKEKKRREKSLDMAIDSIREKYGDDVIKRGVVVKNAPLSAFDKRHVCFNSNI